MSYILTFAGGFVCGIVFAVLATWDFFRKYDG